MAVSQSLLIPGKEWVYEYNVYVPGLPDPLVDQTIETLRVSHDTMISGMSYMVLLASKPEPCGIFLSREFLREEGSKVFRHDLVSGTDFLLMDFGEQDSYLIPYRTGDQEIDTAIVIVDSFGIAYTPDNHLFQAQYVHILNNGSYEDDAPYILYESFGFFQYGLLFPDLGTGLCDIFESIRIRCMISSNDTIRFTDYDCFESIIVGTNERLAQNVFPVFPNPSMEVLYLQTGYTLMAVYDVMGREFPIEKGGSAIAIPTWPPGYYFLRLKAEPGHQMYMVKFLKV